MTGLRAAARKGIDRPYPRHDTNPVVERIREEEAAVIRDGHSFGFGVVIERVGTGGLTQGKLGLLGGTPVTGESDGAGARQRVDQATRPHRPDPVAIRKVHSSAPQVDRHPGWPCQGCLPGRRAIVREEGVSIAGVGPDGLENGRRAKSWYDHRSQDDGRDR